MSISNIKSIRFAVLACAVLALGGCANMTTQQQRVVSGTAIGAITGIAGTYVTGGCVSCGAAIGAIAGAGAGYVVDELNR